MAVGRCHHSLRRHWHRPEAAMEMSIVERGGGEEYGGEGRVRRMVGDWVDLLIIYSLYCSAYSSLGGERSSSPSKFTTS